MCFSLFYFYFFLIVKYKRDTCRSLTFFTNRNLLVFGVYTLKKISIFPFHNA